jgi:hypothetical protein
MLSSSPKSSTEATPLARSLDELAELSADEFESPVVDVDSPQPANTVAVIMPAKRMARIFFIGESLFHKYFVFLTDIYGTAAASAKPIAQQRQKRRLAK